MVVHKDQRTCMSPSPISYPDFVLSRTTLLPKADLSGPDLGAAHLFHANLGKAVLVTTFETSVKYREANHARPTTLIEGDLARAWGDPHQKRDLHFPLHMRLGRV